MREFDHMIIGSGFAGSLMAMILRRQGKSVLMLERGKHPRFAIGESSTPLANLLLEELAQKYDLPGVADFAKWGAWQRAHPNVACGLKRGFTFYQHHFGEEIDYADRTRQLLVAASPSDEIADTHWYRPDFDAHLASLARELGVELIENAAFTLREAGGGWKAEGLNVRARFLIDASGPRGCLFKHFGLREERVGFLQHFPETEALFAHFRSVERIDFAHPELPYPVDDAAVHHVFEAGWIWVLRFNNGMTSAGVAAKKGFGLEEGEPSWRRLLEKLPSVKRLFANATAVTPFYYQPKVAFHSRICAGPNWALLPSAAGFVDPLFSTGFVLTLLGISRLAEGIDLREYERVTFEELNAAGELVSAAYSAFGDFEQFADISRIYFVAAVWAETKRRLGHKPPQFLLCDDAKFRGNIEAYDLAGLTDRSRRNWHPALASDLLASAKKIGASQEELRAMLRRCGFK